MNMIERVAQALEARAKKGQAMPPWRIMAIAAIEAMGDPTTSMRLAARKRMDGCDPEDKIFAYQDMIDAALGEPT